MSSLLIYPSGNLHFIPPPMVVPTFAFLETRGKPSRFFFPAYYSELWSFLGFRSLSFPPFFPWNSFALRRSSAAVSWHSAGFVLPLVVGFGKWRFLIEACGAFPRFSPIIGVHFVFPPVRASACVLEGFRIPHDALPGGPRTSILPLPLRNPMLFPHRVPS